MARVEQTFHRPALQGMTSSNLNTATQVKEMMIALLAGSPHPATTGLATAPPPPAATPTGVASPMGTVPSQHGCGVDEFAVGFRLGRARVGDAAASSGPTLPPAASRDPTALQADRASGAAGKAKAAGKARGKAKAAGLKVIKSPKAKKAPAAAKKLCPKRGKDAVEAAREFLDTFSLLVASSPELATRESRNVKRVAERLVVDLKHAPDSDEIEGIKKSLALTIDIIRMAKVPGIHSKDFEKVCAGSRRLSLTPRIERSCLSACFRLLAQGSAVKVGPLTKPGVPLLPKPGLHVLLVRDTGSRRESPLGMGPSHATLAVAASGCEPGSCLRQGGHDLIEGWRLRCGCVLAVHAPWCVGRTWFRGDP